MAYDTGTMSMIINSKMGDFLYALDKYRIDAMEVFKVLDDVRTGMLVEVRLAG